MIGQRREEALGIIPEQRRCRNDPIAGFTPFRAARAAPQLGVVIGAFLAWSLLVKSPRLRADYTSLRHHAKVHSFRARAIDWPSGAPGATDPDQPTRLHATDRAAITLRTACSNLTLEPASACGKSFSATGFANR